ARANGGRRQGIGSRSGVTTWVAREDQRRSSQQMRISAVLFSGFSRLRACSQNLFTLAFSDCGIGRSFATAQVVGQLRAKQPQTDGHYRGPGYGNQSKLQQVGYAAAVTGDEWRYAFGDCKANAAGDDRGHRRFT